MSSGPVKQVSRQDIQLVQNLIKRCLQLYMSQAEVVETLLNQAKIEPGFTELVWQKLEEENQEFFRAYYLMLMVKQQIQEFNSLLEQQVQLMHLQPTAASSLPNSSGSHIPAVASSPNSNGSHIHTVASLLTSNGSHLPAVPLLSTSNGSHISAVSSQSNSNGSHAPAGPQNQAHYAAERTRGGLKPENIQHPVGSSLSNVFGNGQSSLQATMRAAIDMSAHSSRVNGPPNMLSAQSSNMDLIQSINRGMIKTEPGFSGCSPYIVGAEGNVLEAHPTIGYVSVTSFTNVESNSHSLNEAVLDPDTSFGFLGQIPRNFSLSDLTADFSQSSDILESYSSSPFLATDNGNFLERGEQDNNRLDSISEGLSYEDFRSE
ncbi:PREDICTED: nuclear receptor coactivator 6-like isoform X2 [Lupinus angustifolius]|uniref:nuclear receptor coactivator 6-like isoform X2 n=1 Tax=Lupinus angustifolius TaxID=3871 RepID=UPI00092E93E2|nr:PREDICTED: nuclear receptor coactivator 6-like isoform X2 [Lupinus angustifolius]